MTKPSDEYMKEFMKKRGWYVHSKNEYIIPEPVYIADSVVWATAHKGDETPYYCLYYSGTNSMTVLENRNDVWKEIQFDEIENLYGFFWKFMLEHYSIKERLKEYENVQKTSKV